MTRFVISIRYLILACLFLLAPGCSTVNPYKSPSSGSSSDSGITRASDTAIPDAQSVAEDPSPDLPVIDSLTQSSDQALQDGDLTRASDLLEQALRIQPRNADLWYKLASIRIAEQLWSEAENAAKKSISLARGEAALLQKSWRLIAIARQQSGDYSGAKIATEKAESY